MQLNFAKNESQSVSSKPNKAQAINDSDDSIQITRNNLNTNSNGSLKQQQKAKSPRYFMKRKAEDEGLTNGREVKHSVSQMVSMPKKKKKIEKGRQQWGGYNKILRLEQYNAIIQYAVD